MELSNRLKAVADMVSVGSIVCDSGCDHGYVSIYLVQQKICPHVIAMDINAGPLAQAREHIAAFGLEKYIETRLSDGVTEMSAGEADCLILAGMGGRLVIKILTEGREKIACMKELILQPQSEIAAVRAFLRETGWHICQENIVYEDGKYYPMMKVTRVSCIEEDCGDILCRTAYDKYGAFLLKNRHSVLREFLLWEQKREEEILDKLKAGDMTDGERYENRLKELQWSAEVRKYALSFFDTIHGEEGK